MNERWIRSGPSGPAHLLKLSGPVNYTVACYTTISRAYAQDVPMRKIGSANAPGLFMNMPLDGDICQVCEAKAREQA